MDTDSTILLIVALVAIAGTFFTVVPLVPGAFAAPLGAVASAFVLGREAIPTWLWVLQAVLVGAYLLVDNVAQVLGVRRVGGSRSAMVGGALGVFIGPLVLAFVLGPLALFIGPPIGAVAGTLLGEERARRRAAAVEAAAGAGAGTPPVGPPARTGYTRLGAVALVAFVVGTGVKLAIIGVQVAALAFVVR